MSGIAGEAECALAAARVDFTDYPLPNQFLIGTLFNYTDELMSNRSFEAGISSRDFKIGVADSREQHADRSFLIRGRFGDLANSEAFVVHTEGEHHRSTTSYR
jgi:hypothetical protein